MRVAIGLASLDETDPLERGRKKSVVVVVVVGWRSSFLGLAEVALIGDAAAAAACRCVSADARNGAVDERTTGGQMGGCKRAAPRLIYGACTATVVTDRSVANGPFDNKGVWRFTLPLRAY